MGPGSNNCHLNLFEQSTIEREDEDEEGERRREEERKEGGSDSIEIRGGFGSQPKRSSNVQIAESAGETIMESHCSTMKSSVNGRIEISQDGSIRNPFNSHTHSLLRSPQQTGRKEICHEWVIA